MESQDHPQDATSTTTAALALEAEALTLAPGSASVALAGATMVRNEALTNVQQAVLSSKIAATSKHLTHVGIRRVLARVYSSGIPLTWRLLWRPLGAAEWTENAEVKAYNSIGHTIIDLGEVRLPRAILGEQRWEFKLQARGEGEGAFTGYVDKIYPLPAEQFVRLSTPNTTLLPEASSNKPPATVENDAAGGSVAWVNPGNAKVSDNVYATNAVGAALSNYLKTKEHGFAIPGGRTITGIEVYVEAKATGGAFPTAYSDVLFSEIRLLKAGVAVGSNKSNSGDRILPADKVYKFGGPTDLWGTTWTVADINALTFGTRLQVDGQYDPASTASVDQVYVIVYYSEATDESRVAFAGRKLELRSDGVLRQHITDEVWAPLAPDRGTFMPYAAPSGLEGRKLRGLVLPTESDLATLAESEKTNKITAVIRYRPAYHFVSEMP
jgi:hypothetical protein